MPSNDNLHMDARDIGFSGAALRLRPPRGIKTVKFAVAALALSISALGLVACGSGAGGSATAAHSRTQRSAYEVKAATEQGLGRVLVDGRGYTVYAYVPDHQGASKCYRACAFSWPPFVLPHGVVRPVEGRGVRSALLGATKRTDGALQVTYNGWPLYLYRNDGAPGEATGQGNGMGLWYAVNPSGSLDRRLPS